MLGPGTVTPVLGALRAERAALLSLLAGLRADDWDRPTECPAYTVQGIATHVLGDDLSLLSRQRDGALPGVFRVAAAMPGADFRTLLDAFNDRWVQAASFLSPPLLLTLLELAGEWTAAYHEQVDPEAPGEPVGFFGASGPTSPAWYAYAREYMERWVHHSQIRRALGRTSLADDPFLPIGAQIAATAAGVEATAPTSADGSWSIGPIDLGPRQQAADVLTKAFTAAEIRSLVTGPAAGVDLLAAFAAR